MKPLKLTLILLLIVTSLTFAREKSQKPVENQQQTETVDYSKLVPQTTCPVTGDPIVKSVSVEYQDKTIYFCCPMCIKQFNQNPEKYLKILHDMGQKEEIDTHEEDESVYNG